MANGTVLRHYLDVFSIFLFRYLSLPDGK
jgi:hypothetical protein